MHSTIYSGVPLSGLVQQLRDQARTFVKEELQLAKTELAEKGSCFGRQAVGIAVGGIVAYTGLIVLMAALGMLAAYGFAQLGWDPLLSTGVGLGVIGILVAGICGAIVMSRIKALRTSTLAPQKTLDTLRGFNSSTTQPGTTPEQEPAPKRSTDQIESNVLAVENDLGQTLEEIRHRMSTDYLKQRADEEFHSHPYKWSLVAMGTGLMGGALLGRKLNHSRS